MTSIEKQNIIENNINIEELIKYLTGDFGQRLCMDADGKTYLAEKGTLAIDPEDREVTSVDCVGVGNFDNLEFFSCGWTEWDKDEGVYRVSATGERVDAAEMIARSCREGDVYDCVLGLRESLLENWKD